MMIDDTKVSSDISEAAYKYASDLYNEGCEQWFDNDYRNPTEEDIHEHFGECACHEGLLTKVWEAFEANGPE